MMMQRSYPLESRLNTSTRRARMLPRLSVVTTCPPASRLPSPAFGLLVMAVAAVGLVPGLGLAWHPELPGEAPEHPVALVGGTVHPVSGPAISRGTIVFDQGKIVAVGKQVKLPDHCEVIDVTGKHVYPGWIDADTDLGLIEIGAVRATRDQRETGRINPNVKAQVAWNPDSELIPVARSNGILLVQTAPAGGLISGMSALMMLDGWTWEDMTLRAPVALHVNWPNPKSPSAKWFRRGEKAERKGEKQKEQDSEQGEGGLARLERTFRDARAYWEARKADPDQPVDTRWEAMIDVLRGKVPVVAHADRADQIESAVAFARRHHLRLIISGGYDALECRELLKQHRIPVIVKAVYRLPRHRDDAFDMAYTLPSRLRQAGIPFCIAGFGRGSAANIRNLPYHAATAVAYGLPRDQAIRAISLSAAEILGVADRVGSLEVGKDATLIVCDGDPLEIPTQVERAYIGGRPLDLNNRHRRLWNKYREKYRRQGLLKESH